MRGQTPRAIWSIWVNICAALLILLVLEGIGTVASAVHQRAVLGSDREEIEGLLRAGASADAEWARDYVREFAQVRVEWHPYVYWRIRPYRGKYVNVDSAGIRHTWNSPSSSSPGQLKIFMFGGSSLWGIGARDEFTIPSLLSKRLAGQTARGIRVTNFGEIGWVTTQEVIALMLELRQGNVPDIVVFYDGGNDYSAAFQNGVAGIPLNEANRVREFNVLRGGDLRRIVLRRLALYRWSERVVMSLRGSRGRSFPGENPAVAEPLAEAVVDMYLQNIEIVESLSSRYGFKVFFFWQPVIFTKRNLSQEEREELGRRRNTRVAPFFGHVQNTFRKKMSTGKFASLHDLTDVFGDDGRTAFIDAVHLLESGNDQVASAMVQALESALRRASGQ